MWVQIPLWISISMSLRNLVYMLPKHDQVAELSYAQLSTEGIGWISNLTEADPFFVLPITFGIVNLALIELTTMSKVTELTKFQKIVTNLFRGFTIILVPICASIPSVSIF
ncbi:hypothetical protein HHI36_017932 [Cryptolaemus montrouzieri]|uniref:Uncharacterized protein n=1 Tax=Cryptolaemus montrouzieri TaxID=559131 RepID=A0ABD2NYH5_9CUCU